MQDLLDPSTKMYAMRRMAHTPGWTVALVRRGQSLQRCFTVFRHGTEDAALAAALAWRDAQALKTQAYTKAEMSQLTRTNNTSGRSGVYLMRQRRPRSGGRVAEYIFWLARTPEGVQPQRSVSFSVQKFGDEGAYARAVAARCQFERELQGHHLNRVPLHLHPSSASIAAGAAAEAGEAALQREAF